jgi:hypothetical protein
MKSLIIIWLVALLTIVGGIVYFNHVINSLLLEVQSAPINGYTSLEVVYNYEEQKTANIHVIEPKVSGAYLQWGANQLQGAYNE